MIPVRKIIKKYDDESTLARNLQASEINFYKNLCEIKWAIESNFKCEIQEILPGEKMHGSYLKFNNTLKTDIGNFNIKYNFNREGYKGYVSDAYTGASLREDVLDNCLLLKESLVENCGKYDLDLYIYGTLDSSGNLCKLIILDWHVFIKLRKSREFQLGGSVPSKFGEEIRDIRDLEVNEYPEETRYPSINKPYGDPYVRVPVMGCPTAIANKFPKLIIYKRGFN